MTPVPARAGRQHILEVLTGILREHLDFDGEVHPDLRLVEDVGLDSLRMLTLVVEVENSFSICLEEGDEQGVVTVSDLAALVEVRLAS